MIFSGYIWSLNNKPQGVRTFGVLKRRILNVFLATNDWTCDIFQKYGEGIAADLHMPWITDADKQHIWQFLVCRRCRILHGLVGPSHMFLNVRFRNFATNQLLIPKTKKFSNVCNKSAFDDPRGLRRLSLRDQFSSRTPSSNLCLGKLHYEGVCSCSVTIHLHTYVCDCVCIDVLQLLRSGIPSWHSFMAFLLSLYHNVEEHVLFPSEKTRS